MQFTFPVWRTQQQMFATAIPAAIACWLFDPGSLTARVIAACPGRFHVEVLSQSWQRASVDEAQRLHMTLHERALIREVYLCCDAIPWVFARTIMPQRTLTGRQKFLAHLGARPLGAVLFADPHMHRDPMEVTHLSMRQQLFHKAMLRSPDAASDIWARRSVFYLGAKPLLVNEIFLPTVARCKVSAS